MKNRFLEGVIIGAIFGIFSLVGLLGNDDSVVGLLGNDDSDYPYGLFLGLVINTLILAVITLVALSLNAPYHPGL